MLFSPALFEIGFAGLAGLPYVKQGLDLLMSRKRELVRPEQRFSGSLTILLPGMERSQAYSHKSWTI